MQRLHRSLCCSNEQRRVQRLMPGMLLTFPGSSNGPCFSTSFSPPFVQMKKKKKARDFSSSASRRLAARYSFLQKKVNAGIPRILSKHQRKECRSWLENFIFFSSIYSLFPFFNSKNGNSQNRFQNILFQFFVPI